MEHSRNTDTRSLKPDRLEAFSDAVIAIIMTIMALELHPPAGHSFDEWIAVLPHLIAYLLSFVFLGIYWNNHHHLFRAAKRITGGVMWANIHLLFWLSLIPLVTAWVGEGHNYLEGAPVIAYGIIGLMASMAYGILIRTLQRHNDNGVIATRIGRDIKGWTSSLLYTIGIALAMLHLPLLGIAAYVGVSVLWFVPDRRLYGNVTQPHQGDIIR